MTRLRSTGTFTYNGITFDENTQCKVTARPVPGSGNRVTKYVDVSIEVSGWIVEDQFPFGTDDQFEEMRRLLSEPGGALEFTAKGYGRVKVNMPAGLRDVDFGPKPQVLTWVPRGDAHGCYVQWTCVTRIPECADARDQGIITYESETSYDINDNGYTTITYSGNVEIASTRNGRLLLKTADDYREDVTPPVPLGFRRRQRFVLSPDKKTLTWTVTDEQVRMPLPLGISQMPVKHTVRSSLKQGFQIWDCGVSGSIVLPPNMPKSAAWPLIMTVVLSRIGDPTAGGPPKQIQVGTKKGTLINSIAIDDDVFGDRVGFDVGYTVFGASLGQVIKTSGLFAPVPGTDFQKWRASLERGAWSPRGCAGLKFHPSMDILLDLCSDDPPRKPDYLPILPDNSVGPPNIPKADKADPRKSFLFFDCAVDYYEDGKIISTRPNQGKPRPEPPGGFNIGGLANVAANVVKSLVGAYFPFVEVNFQTGPPAAGIRIVGRALRVDYPIPRPKLDSIMGIKPGNAPGQAPCKAVWFSHKPAGQTIDGSPLFAAMWQIDYLLPRPLPVQDSPVTANLSWGSDGNL